MLHHNGQETMSMQLAFSTSAGIVRYLPGDHPSVTGSLCREES